MDVVLLSRLQFGLTAFFHFLFPPVTIGLATIIAVIEYLYWRRREEIYDKMARFWFKLFTILFAVGVASGITSVPTGRNIQSLWVTFSGLPWQPKAFLLSFWSLPL